MPELPILEQVLKHHCWACYWNWRFDTMEDPFFHTSRGPTLRKISQYESIVELIEGFKKPVEFRPRDLFHMGKDAQISYQVIRDMYAHGLLERVGKTNAAFYKRRG